jgi:cell division protein FtsI (penicillin-binding protein 3)
MKQFIKRPLMGLSKHLKLWHEVAHQSTLVEMAKQRVFVAGTFIILAYATICGRLVDVMLFRQATRQQHPIQEHTTVSHRSDIHDRNGAVLATDLVTASVYANPKVILNAKDAAEKLSKLLPEVGFDVLYQRLTCQKGFVWVARHVPPKLQQAINQLGIPGVYLQKDHRRVYPYGNLVSHVLGYCGVDRNGLAGFEKSFDMQMWQSKDPVQISLDVRVQHVVRDQLMNAIEEFNCIAANAVVMDVDTGEVLAMVSLPDYDPNMPNQNAKEATFNRNTLGVYEPGSTFKILNTAIALESGTANLNSMYDARFPIQIGHFKIDDFKGKYRVLSLKEAFVYSSNIAAIKIALEFGTNTQKSYFKKFGVFDPVKLEIPENGMPLIPGQWREITTMTAAYGYGISVTPMQTLKIVSSIVTGQTVTPTLIYQKNIAETEPKAQLVSEKTAKSIRELMRTVVSEGTSRKADIAGMGVFGKTGTAYKVKGKGYSANTSGLKPRTTFFIGGFPHNKPKYMVMVMLDEPKPAKGTYGYAAAGWNVTPTAGKIIERIAPLLGFKPQDDQPPSPLIHTAFSKEE